MLISEWSDPAAAIPAGFHIDFFLAFGEPAYGLLLGPNSRPDGDARKPHAFFELAGGGDIKAFIQNYLKHYTVTKSRGYISIPTANHDTPRPTWGRDEQEVRTIFAMLLTMPGVPFIYYGDEIGMHYLPQTPNREGGLLDDIQRCGSRTPMQWSKRQPRRTLSSDRSVRVPAGCGEPGERPGIHVEFHSRVVKAAARSSGAGQRCRFSTPLCGGKELSVRLPAPSGRRAYHRFNKSYRTFLCDCVERGGQPYSVTRARRRVPERSLGDGPGLFRHLRSRTLIGRAAPSLFP